MIQHTNVAIVFWTTDLAILKKESRGITIDTVLFCGGCAAHFVGISFVIKDVSEITYSCRTLIILSMSQSAPSP